MKETFYFSHDYNARNDEKIISLRRKHGWNGYGLFWALIEMLSESKEHKLSISLLEDFAYDMRADLDCISSIIKDYDLFQYDEKFFWSNRLNSHFKNREYKSNKAKESAMKRWENKGKNANALQSECEPNAIKESKVKEKKVNEMFAFVKDFNTRDGVYKKYLDKMIDKGVDRREAEYILANFYNHWSDEDSSGKMLWQKKDTFSLGKRLSTWSMKHFNWKK